MKAEVSFTLNDGLADAPPATIEARDVHDLFNQVFEIVRGDNLRPPANLPAGAKLEVKWL